MKTQKISLSKMEGKMSREEMKNVIGGVRQQGVACGTYTCGSCPSPCGCGTSKNGPCI